MHYIAEYLWVSALIIMPRGMAAIKQYSPQMHEQTIALCCEETESSPHFVETGCSASPLSFTCPWTLWLIRGKAEKVGHRGMNANIWTLPLKRIYDNFPFLWLCGWCDCVLVSRTVQWLQQMAVKGRSGFMQLLNVNVWRKKSFNDSFRWRLFSLLSLFLQTFSMLEMSSFADRVKSRCCSPCRKPHQMQKCTKKLKKNGLMECFRAGRVNLIDFKGVRHLTSEEQLGSLDPNLKATPLLGLLGP